MQLLLCLKKNVYGNFSKIASVKIAPPKINPKTGCSIRKAGAKIETFSIRSKRFEHFFSGKANKIS